MRILPLEPRTSADRMRDHHLGRARLLAAAVTLVCLTVLLVPSGTAIAADIQSISYDTPAAWAVIEDGPDPVWIQYSASDEDIFGWVAYGEVYITGVLPGELPNVQQVPTGDLFFSSYDDFAARSAAVWYNNQKVSGPSGEFWVGARQTTIGGFDAYVNTFVMRGETFVGQGATNSTMGWQCWVPTDTGGLSVSAMAYVWGHEPDDYSQLDPIVSDLEHILASLRFDDSPASGPASPGGENEAPGGDTAGPSSGTSPWRTIVGGLGAVAAAAIAIAGAAASGRAKSGEEEPPPDQPIGYVLQLSAARLTVSEAHAAPLTAQAFKVMPGGSYQPATDAAIVLHLPAGLSAQPSTAYGTLSGAVWQIGPVSPGEGITVEATAPLGSTSAHVPVTAAGESRIVTRLEPAGTVELRTHGGHSVTLAAAVELVGGDAEDPTIDPAVVRGSIVFAETSDWLDISVPADYEDGRAVTVIASQPDPTSMVQPPESAAVRVSAQIGERVLTEVVTIPLERLPEIDARPDRVAFAADSGQTAEVSVWIDNAAGATWRFETEWREGSRPIAVPDIVSTGSATATLTVTENGGDRLDAARPETAATLVLVATADGFEPLRRQVQVVVIQEGLFVDRTNVDPSTGAFGLKADGSATPIDIDLRVFVRDPATGVVAPDIGLAQQALLEVGGREGMPGHAGLRAGGLVVTPAGVRPLNVPSATFRVALERPLPTGGEALPAALRASVPGQDDSTFSTLVSLRLLGVNTDPFSAAWQTELDNCRDVIQKYVPFEYQERLYALVNERSLTMGAEGLYAMRKQLMNFAHDQLMKEAHEHLDSAWWIQQIEDTLDWVSWCGDIALGVASGAYLGVVGSVAIGMLKPLLVSGMETWIRGGSLEDWLLAQSATLTGALEGAATDPDFLTKLSGNKKAIGWALFITYNFAKELCNDPKLSVTDAMTRIGKQLRDEGLIRFLIFIVHLNPKGLPAGAKLKPAGSDPAKAPGPDAAKSTPDARDAARKQPDGPEKAPEGSEKPAPEKRAPEKPAPEKPGAKKPRPSPTERATSIADDIAAKTADGGSVDRSTTERVMSDPDAMRELRKNHPEAWKKFNETRSKIYEGHDRKLKEWIENNVPEAAGREIVVDPFGNPEGTDRDYRAGYITTDPVTGQRRFIELKKEKWAGKSAEIFAAETGGPTDPAGAKKWANDRQQLATDAHHAEAPVDMADQAKMYNEKTGQWEKTQITPNADMVKAGRSTLLDPKGYGTSYETKVLASHNQGNTLDAYAQAGKAAHSLEDVRKGYDAQGYEVRDLPSQVDAGLGVIKDVHAGKLDAAGADAKLRSLGYEGGLPELMEKVSGQFESLKWARKA
ncbi:MAG: hypothetical protein KKA32_16650 [Actinobacteria bacterium]|nr:hypothetical protein [Actinomycetota bacterium]